MFAHSSSSSQNKRKVIKNLKEINRELVYSQYKTYYKIYKQQPKHSSSLYPLKTNYDFTKNKFINNYEFKDNNYKKVDIDFNIPAIHVGSMSLLLEGLKQKLEEQQKDPNNDA